MIDSIGGANAAQATHVPTPRTNITPAPVATAPAAAEPEAAAPTQNAESAAAARLGEQLNAQADAARVQRAVDQATTGDTTEDTETASDAGATQAPAAASAAPAGGAGGAAASSETTDTDYIAEADTNSDKTVSDEERAAYEAKLREQNEKQAEVRAVYGQDEDAAPALDVTA